MEENLGPNHLLQLKEGLVVLESISKMLCCLGVKPIESKAVHTPENKGQQQNESQYCVINCHGALTL